MNTADKPGYKTTEFWFSTLAAVVGIVIASGIVPESGLGAQLVGALVSGLAALGYSVSRGLAKH